MQRVKSVSLQIAGAVALAMLFGTSAFAESRHQQVTRGGSGHSSGRTTMRAPRSESRGVAPRFSSRGATPRFESRGAAPRFNSRGVTPRFESRSAAPRFSSRGATPRFESRGAAPRFSSRSVTPRYESRGVRSPRFESRPSEAWRGGRGFDRGTAFRGGSFYNSGSRFFGRGRINRIVRYGGGYRVWLDDCGYPYFVPFSFFDPFRFRIGSFIGFNAFYDPLGFYSVYDLPPDGYAPVDAGSYYRDDSSYRDGNANRAGTLHGIVESVDLQLGTVVLSDDTSHQVTALLPPRDRRVDDIRPGDYVEFSGA
jgi:hypothetical protein